MYTLISISLKPISPPSYSRTAFARCLAGNYAQALPLLFAADHGRRRRAATLKRIIVCEPALSPRITRSILKLLALDSRWRRLHKNRERSFAFSCLAD